MRITVWYKVWDNNSEVVPHLLKEEPDNLDKAIQMVEILIATGFRYEVGEDIVFIPPHMVVEARIDR